MDKYSCPMHPEIVRDRPGTCPKCHMDLVQKSEISDQTKKTKLATFTPLIVIISLILFVTFLLAWKSYLIGSFSVKTTLTNFMSGFFIVFAGFKLLDLKGFAHGYSSYDLLARRIPRYGYIYPFIELLLGSAYLIKFEPSIYLNILVFIIMTFSGLGVVESLAKKRKFQCACLGTFIKVPLTNVTLVEDFGMATMALIMIIY